jgi:hypothetical protein
MKRIGRLNDQSNKSYDVVSFFFLTEFVTLLADSFSVVSRIRDEVTNEPCIAEIKIQIHLQHQACGMGALECCVLLEYNHEVEST